jgi:RNA polymerase sigma-70 factor (ECF subfamily)
VAPLAPIDLDRLLAAGRAAWPGVDLDPARFAEHVRARLGDGDPSAIHAADLYLACACEAGDPRALAAFEARYIAEVPAFLAGVTREPAAIEEVRQRVRERLFVAAPGARPKIAEYAGRGALASWVRVVVLRVASNLRRAERPHADLEIAAETKILPGVDPELATLRARYQPAFDEALRASFAELTPRERTLFRMHFLDGLALDRMAVVFDVHRATVARWIAAARQGLVDRTMARLGAELRLSPTELDSLLAVVRSGLDLSLPALLADQAI